MADPNPASTATLEPGPLRGTALLAEFDERVAALAAAIDASGGWEEPLVDLAVFLGTHAVGRPGLDEVTSVTETLIRTQDPAEALLAADQARYLITRELRSAPPAGE